MAAQDRAEPLANPSRRDTRRCNVRRIALVASIVPLILLLAAGPVAADTGPGGTNFSSSASTCAATGGRTVCTDTELSVFANEDGSAGPPCLQVSKYSIGSNGRFTSISDEFGCADEGGMVIGSDLSVTIAPVTIDLQTCARRTCSTSRIVTVSASDSPTGPISTSTTRSTTKSGGCTTRTTVDEQFAELAGTMTIDTATIDQTGFVDVISQTSITHCK